VTPWLRCGGGCGMLGAAMVARLSRLGSGGVSGSGSGMEPIVIIFRCSGGGRGNPLFRHDVIEQSVPYPTTHARTPCSYLVTSTVRVITATKCKGSAMHIELEGHAVFGESLIAQACYQVVMRKTVDYHKL